MPLRDDVSGVDANRRSVHVEARLRHAGKAEREQEKQRVEKKEIGVRQEERRRYCVTGSSSSSSGAPADSGGAGIGPGYTACGSGLAGDRRLAPELPD